MHVWIYIFHHENIYIFLKTVRRISLCSYALQLPLAVVFSPNLRNLKLLKKIKTTSIQF